MAAVIEAPGPARRTPAWVAPVLLGIGILALVLASFAVGRVTAGDGPVTRRDMVQLHDSMSRSGQMPMTGMNGMTGTTGMPMMTTTTTP